MTRTALCTAIGFLLAALVTTGAARADWLVPANKSSMLYDFAVWHPPYLRSFRQAQIQGPQPAEARKAAFHSRREQG
jgi:hypothetical protein